MERSSAIVAGTLALAGALVASPLLSVAGVQGPLPSASPDIDPGSEPTPASNPGLSEGHWWAFEVTVREEQTFLAAVVVHDSGPERVKMGTNRSGSILGLPFSGNFSGDLNPEFAGQTWEMYRFPLHEGKAWDQEFLGHQLNTTVEARELDDPEGNGTVEGYQLEATAYSRTVATYTYHPEARWLSELSIRDPRSGDMLLEADLLAYGSSWDGAYYVTEVLHEADVAYPTQLPGETRFTVPDGYERARVQLTSVVDGGGVDAEVRGPDGETRAASQVLVRGSHVASGTVEVPAGEWSFAHKGAGDARVHLKVLGVRAVEPTSDAGDGGSLDDVIPSPPQIGSSLAAEP